MKNVFNNIIKKIKENKVKSIIGGVIVLVLLLGISYAAFLITKEIDEKEVTYGILDIEYIDGQTINATDSLPITEEEIDEYASKTDFTIKNTGNIPVYLQVALTNITIDSALKSSDFKYALYRGDAQIATGTFENCGTELILKSDILQYVTDNEVTYTIALWIQDNGGNQNAMLNQNMSAKIRVKATDRQLVYTDKSGANAPELADGMIPVVYDETNDVWVKADIHGQWYNYDKQWWANAVTVTSTNRAKYLSNSHIGKEIPMDEINSMWVWIPRYKYKIATGLGSTTALTSPPQIDIIFEKGVIASGATEATYRAGMSGTSDATNTIYYTHPAFRNISNITYSTETQSRGAWDEEITGFWVGKFEPGGSASAPKITPNVYAIRAQNISTQFTTALKFAGGTMNTSTGEVTFTANASNTYGLNTTTNTTDTHMMKNTEWGAVAILSQSKYGKMGNPDYEGTNKEIYKNDSEYGLVGRSCGATGCNASNYGTYSYNDKSCATMEGVICTGSKTKNAGTGASTTGNIYGIYDMSGGAYEYVMGNWGKYSGSTSYNSGFTGTNGSSSGGVSFPESKYYDLYKGTSSSTATREKSIMGDATWETMRWYSDFGNFAAIDNPWFVRGGGYNNSAGIFTTQTYYKAGEQSSVVGWRAVLMP